MNRFQKAVARRRGARPRATMFHVEHIRAPAGGVGPGRHHRHPHRSEAERAVACSTPEADCPGRRISRLHHRQPEGRRRKTTAAVNVAAALARQGRRSSSSTSIRRATSTPRSASSTAGYRVVLRVLIGEIPLGDALERSPHNARRTVFRSPSTCGAEIDRSAGRTRRRLRRALADLQNDDFDDVSIDARRHRVCDHQRARRGAGGGDLIDCEYDALEAVGQLVRNIEMVKADLDPQLNVSTVILTMYDGGTRLADQVAEHVRNTSATRYCDRDPAQRQGVRGARRRHDDLDYDPGRAANYYLHASRGSPGRRGRRGQHR